MASPNDIESLRVALVQAARACLADARKRHKGERLYSFVLFTEPLLGYVAPSLNTEESLARKGKEKLRWRPPDWEYHGEGREHFDTAQALLKRLRREGGISEEEQDRSREQRWSAFVGALKQLDEEGTFGTGEARDAILINIMWGDQDVPAFLESAEQLNPRVPFLAYARHVLPDLRANVAEMQRYPAAREATQRAATLLSRLERELSAGS